MKKLGKLYDAFIILVIIIKLIFVVFAVLTKFYKYKINHSNQSEISYYTKQYNWSNYWKERLESIFLICMGFICIIVFNPFYGYRFVIDEETRILLFLFGIIILITSNWHVIF
jgi:hypothetical protein